MHKIDVSIPITDDFIVIKDHGIKLQNYIQDLTKYVNAFQLMVDLLNAELSHIRDRAILEAEKSEECKSKTQVFKEAFGKSQFKFKVTVPSPLPDDELIKPIDSDFNYHELKKLIAVYTYKLNRAKSRHDEVKGAIDLCKFYPSKL